MPFLFPCCLLILAALSEASLEDLKFPSFVHLKAPAEADVRERLRREHPSSRDYEEGFCADVNRTVTELLKNEAQQTLLVHTDRGIEILSGNATSGPVYPIQAELFDHFKIISHFAVRALTILLPVLDRQDNATLDNVSMRLNTLRSILHDPHIPSSADDEQRQVTMEIIDITSDFLESVNTTGKVSKEQMFEFTKELKRWLQKAAQYAVEDYYESFMNITKRAVNESVDQLAVIALSGFAHRSSFLFKFYEYLLGSSERILLLSCHAKVPGPGLLRQAVASNTLTRSLNELFSHDELHSILSEEAVRLINQQKGSTKSYVSFTYFLEVAALGAEDNSTGNGGNTTEGPPGFKTTPERIYVIVIVILCSLITVLLVTIISICVEDRVMKMEDKKAKAKLSSQTLGPSLLTPLDEVSDETPPAAQIAEESVQAYVNSSAITATDSPDDGDDDMNDKESSPCPAGSSAESSQYIRADASSKRVSTGAGTLASPGKRASKVTVTEITLADLDES